MNIPRIRRLLVMGLLLLGGMQTARSQVRVVTVHSVNQLLDALADNTTIYLQPGNYDLAQADSVQRPHCQWRRGFSQNELHIVGLHHLHIESLQKWGATITSQAHYGTVIVLEDCAHVWLRGLKIDRDKTHADCQGGALSFIRCHDLRLERLQIIACRPQGLALRDCRHVQVTRSSLRTSTRQAIDVARCNEVLFTDCAFRTNSGQSLISVDSSNSVRFHRCALLDNHLLADSAATYLIAQRASTDVGLWAGVIDHNRASYLAPASMKPAFSKVQIRLENTWTTALYDHAR